MRTSANEASEVQFNVSFQQGRLPVVDSDGKILLASKGRISQGPNGNGGCFLALKESGALEDMKRRGVEWVFFYSVDNALVKVCDIAGAVRDYDRQLILLAPALSELAAAGGASFAGRSGCSSARASAALRLPPNARAGSK